MSNLLRIKPIVFIIIFKILFTHSSVFSQEPEVIDESLRNALIALSEIITIKKISGITITNPHSFMSGNPGAYEYSVFIDKKELLESEFEIHGPYTEGENGKIWNRTINNDLIEEWLVDKAGNIHLLSETSLDSGYKVKLQSHLILPIGAVSGDSWDVSSKLNAYKIDDLEELAYTGTLSGVRKYEGAFQAVIPSGTYNCILLSEEYSIEIGPVKIKDKKYGLYAEEKGKIAEIDGQHISAFLIIHMKENKIKLLK